MGLLGTRDGTAVHLESKSGRAKIVGGVLEVIEGLNPLEPYGTSTNVVRAVEHLVKQPNAGDIIIFGAYDGYEIVSFDDQIGAHGAAGGQQVFPFVIGPAYLELETARLDDARDIHSAIMMKYARYVCHPEPKVCRTRGSSAGQRGLSASQRSCSGFNCCARLSAASSGA